MKRGVTVTHYRDTHALIRLDYLQDNVNTLYQRVQKPMMAIIKANAYGHGYQEVANVLKLSLIHILYQFGMLHIYKNYLRDYQRPAVNEWHHNLLNTQE